MWVPDYVRDCSILQTTNANALQWQTSCDPVSVRLQVSRWTLTCVNVRVIKVSCYRYIRYISGTCCKLNIVQVNCQRTLWNISTCSECQEKYHCIMNTICSDKLLACASLWCARCSFTVIFVHWARKLGCRLHRQPDWLVACWAVACFFRTLICSLSCNISILPQLFERTPVGWKQRWYSGRKVGYLNLIIWMSNHLTRN